MLSRYKKAEKLSLLLKLFGEKAGRCGMVYGQMLDLEYERGLSGEKKLSLEAVNKVNRYKTGCLLQLSLLCGAINGGAKSERGMVAGNGQMAVIQRYLTANSIKI